MRRESKILIALYIPVLPLTLIGGIFGALCPIQNPSIPDQVLFFGTMGLLLSIPIGAILAIFIANKYPTE